MINHRDPQKNPLMQSVVQHYPFSMLFSLFSSFSWTGISLYSRSPYTVLPMMQTALLLYGFALEFKRLIPHPVKIKNYFDNKEFYYAGQLAAVLKNENNNTPSLEIYHPDMIGLAAGNLLGLDYLEMRRKYSPFLFLNAQLRKGPVFQDAIKTINQRTRERGINVEYKLLELHQFLLEANKKLIENNLTVSSALHDSPITIDELRAYNHFPDDFKGNLACSVYIPPSDEVHDFDIARDFDWPGAGDLPLRFKRFNYPTGHKDHSKPQFVISLTLPLNFAFTATNGHIILAMNEVEKSETMRRNQQGGYTQFDLANEILKNCCSLDEIEVCIKEHPPASPCILIAVTKNGSAIIEMLPTLNENENPPLYRIIQAGKGLVATNHFQGHPESATISCSLPRWEKMMNAVKDFPDDPWKIAAASASNDTGHTLIAKWQENGDLIIQWNIATYNSAIARDPEDNQFRYDELNVTEYGKTFLLECEKQRIKFNISSIDQQLMELCKSAYQVESEEIAQCLRDIYSQLTFEKSKIELNHREMPSSLTLEKIENIARESNNIVQVIMNKNQTYEFKLQLLDKYKQLNPDTDRLQISLASTLLFGMIAMIAWGPTGFTLVRTGLNCLINNIAAASAIYFASAPLRNAYKTSPDLAFFTKAMAKQLGEKLKQERDQHGVTRKIR